MNGIRDFATTRSHQLVILLKDGCELRMEAPPDQSEFTFGGDEEAACSHGLIAGKAWKSRHWEAVTA